jgi:hypothetical protein
MRKEVIRDWRKLHNEKLCNLYSSPNIIYDDQVKEEEMDGVCSMYGRKENAHNI